MIKHILKIVWNRKRANALIVAEIFLSFLVLFAVLTMAASLISSVRQPLGLNWRDVWNVSVEANPEAVAAESTPKSEIESIDMVMRELAAMPQIAAVAGSQTPPYAMSENHGSWLIDGKEISVTFDKVTDDFAEVMQLKVVRGRWFSREDDAAGFVPVVIDVDLAASLYGDGDPIGKKFAEIEDIAGKGKKEQRVVGVIARYRKNGEFTNFGKPINMLFERASAVTSEKLPDNILVRLQPGTSAAFEEVLNARLHQIAPHMNFRIRHMSRMREFAHRAALLPLVALGIVTAFLITMVVLGLSGVLWQNVTRRTREIGVRRAIGATRPAVQKQIVTEVAMLTTLAVILGAVVVTQLPILGIFTVITEEAFAMGVIASLATIYGLTIACGLYPGWLASRVQPAQALHYE